MRYIAAILTLALPFVSCFGASYTSMTNKGINSTSRQIILELSTVANEIQAARGSYGGDEQGIQAVGDNAAALATESVPEYTNKWTLKQMQILVEESYDEFMPVNQVIEGVTNKYISPLIGYTNWAHFATAAGLSTNGWRNCKTNWPSNWENLNDSAYDYDDGTLISTRANAGDYRGPWNFDDLQLAFDALGWEYEPFDSGHSAWNLEGTASNWVYDTGASTNWDTAKAGIVWPDGLYKGYDDDAYPIGFYEGTVTDYFRPTTVTNFRAYARLAQNSLVVSRASFTNVPAIIDFYARATYIRRIGTGILTFDAHGADVISNTWHRFSTVTGSTVTVYSDLLGVMTPKPTETERPEYANYRKRGWFVEGEAAVIKRKWSYTRE